MKCAEISVLWAAHQVHHSSEEYNLTTALRQSVFQGLGGWPFYLPLALVLPPSLAVVHMPHGAQPPLPVLVRGSNFDTVTLIIIHNIPYLLVIESA